MKGYARSMALGAPERDRLIAEHTGMARRIALRIARGVPSWLSKDDLIATAMVGLTEAADRYDSTRAEPFVAFAARRVRGAVIDELRKGDILPRRARATARRIGVTIRALEQSLGRPPEDEEIAKKLEVSVEEYRSNLEGLSRVSFVDLVPEEVDQQTSGSGESSPAQLLEIKELKERLVSSLQSLKERDALLLSLYYQEELTYAEIGKVLGVTESRVCQLHSRAIVRLRAEFDETRKES